MTYNIDFIYKETNLPTRYTLEKCLNSLPENFRIIMNENIKHDVYERNPITKKLFVNYKKQYIEKLYDFINNNEIDLFLQIIPYMIGCFDETSLHFMLLKLNDIYYKKRDDIYFYNKTKEICKQDIILIEKLDIRNFFCPTVNRLITIYEKEKKIFEAIQICKLAIERNLQSHLINGFEGKYEKLSNKLIEISTNVIV